MLLAEIADQAFAAPWESGYGYGGGVPEDSQGAFNGGYFQDAAYTTGGLINVIDEDARTGGHNYIHVGINPQALLSRMQGNTVRAGILTFVPRADGSFTSWGAANSLVSATLAANAPIVEQVANGTLGDTFVTSEFPSPTGYEGYRPSPNASPYIRDTYGVGVLVIQDPSSPRGFGVFTSYPMNPWGTK